MVTKTPYVSVDMTNLDYLDLKTVMNPKVNSLRSKHFKKLEVGTKRYLDKVSKAIEEEDNVDTKLLLKQHGEEIVYQYLHGSRKYSENILNFRFDELNELDRAGLANYSRPYQIVYSLDTLLAEISGDVFRCLPKDIKSNIGFNMRKQGLTYEAGSRAVITNSPNMIKDLTYGWYLDVHENIDYSIAALLRKTKLSDYIDRFGDEIKINTSKHTEEYAFNVIMLTIINKYVEVITLAVLRELMGRLEKSYGKQVLVSSKGISSIVIQSHEYIEPTDLTAHVKLDTMELEITPTVTKQLEYYKVFLKGE